MAEDHSPYAEQIVAESLKEFQQLQTMRTVLGNQWEEVAELVDPDSRNTFYYGNYNFPGLKKTDRQVDSSAQMALERFAAILDSLLTPRNMMWHTLTTDNPYLSKNSQVAKYFEQVTRILFKARYSPIANFSAQNYGVYRSLGAYGNGFNFVDAYQGVDGQRGLRYKQLPVGEMFIRENHQGLVDGFCRWFRLTPQQACKQFPDTIPDSIRARADNKDQMPVEFLHRVCPRDDYEPGRWDQKGKIYASYYICLTTNSFLAEGGYNTFPLAASRYIQMPTDGPYGRGPAMIVLPAIKTLNAEKRDFLTQGHRAASPILLTTDDGVVDFSMRPGALNKGGMNEDGKPLVGILPSGNIQITKEMMDEERGLVNSAFLVDLFKWLFDDPKVYTATQITEMAAQRGVLIAPTVGRQQSEYLGPLIDRELDILGQLHMLPPMPPILKEARGEYHVQYTSPLARDMRSQEVAGAMRTIDMAIQVVNATGDPSVLDRFDFDTIIADSADIQGMPASWLADDNAVAGKRQARAQAQERQQQQLEAPAQAALAKAQAAQVKAGIRPGQFGPLTGPVNAPAPNQAA